MRETQHSSDARFDKKDNRSNHTNQLRCRVARKGQLALLSETTVLGAAARFAAHGSRS